MPRIYFFFQSVQLAKYQVNDLSGVRRHLSWTLWVLCQVVTPLATLSLVGAVFFSPSWGRLPGPHHSSVGASTTKVICSSGVVVANCLQGVGQ